MSDDREIGFVKFSFGFPLKPWGADPTNYFSPAVGEIVAYLNVAEGVEDQEAAGRIDVTLIKFTEAFNAHMDFEDIFREASLDDVHAALFDKSGDFKEKLEIPLLPGEIIFIKTVKLKAKYRRTNLLLQAIEALIPALSSTGLILAYRETLDLGMKEWKKLCFDPIRGTDIVYRNDFEIDPRRRLFRE